MTYMEFKLETAREIIRMCEDFQQSDASAFSKSEEQRSAYRQLKDLLIDEEPKGEQEQ